jgi:hypothetical protein
MVNTAQSGRGIFFLNRADGLYNGGDVLVISSGFYTDLAASMERPWVLPSFPPHYPTKPDGSNPSTFLWVDKRKSKRLL